MSVPTGYTLVYGEEFDGSSLPSPWQLGYYFSNTVPSSAVTVSGGALHLTWSSGGVSDISVSSTQTFHYGYFEVRMKWTVSNGAWPAFWFIPPSGIAHTGEIDVFEGQGNDSGGYFATLHEWNGSTQLWQSTPNRFPISTDFSQYHTYALLWEPGGVFSWYFDDVLIHTETIPDHAIFDTQSVFPILSMQEGNNWSVGNTSGVSASTLTTDVDYFRVYQGTTGSSTGTGGGGTSGSTASVGPVLIGPSPTSYTYGYDMADNPNGQFGFQYGSNLYLVLNQGNFGDYGIHVFQSPTGATWTELDSAHTPTGEAIAGYGEAFTVAVDGSTVWVMQFLATFVDGGTGAVITGIKVTSFDLTTGTWGSSNTFTSPLPAFTRGHQIVARLLVRGPGDLVLFYSSTRETVSGTSYARCSYVTFDGSSFGTPTLLPGQTGVANDYVAFSGVVDSAGIVHFFYHYGAAFSIGSEFRHIGLSSSGTWGTEQTMPWQVMSGTGDYSQPILYQESGVEKIAFAAGIFDPPPAPSFTNQIILAYADAALTPTWATSVVSSYPDVFYVQGFDLIPASIALAYKSGTMHITYTWVDADTEEPQTSSHNRRTEYRYTSAPTSTFTWTAPVTLWSPPNDPDLATVGNPYNRAWCAYQLYMFSGDMGVGVIGISDDDFAYPAAEFYLIGSSSSSSGNGPTPPITFLCIMFDSLGKLRLANTTTDPVSLVT